MIEIYGKEQCPFCDMAKVLCTQKQKEYKYFRLIDTKSLPLKNAFLLSSSILTAYNGHGFIVIPSILFSPIRLCGV